MLVSGLSYARNSTRMSSLGVYLYCLFMSCVGLINEKVPETYKQGGRETHPGFSCYRKVNFEWMILSDIVCGGSGIFLF